MAAKRSASKTLVLALGATVAAWLASSAQPSFTPAAAVAFTPAAAAGRSPAVALRLAARAGAREGCRGQRACMRAVGLFFATQTGSTEEAAGVIAEATGLEAVDIGDLSAEDLTGFDGLIVGAPTWNTGADEFRSGTTFDDYLEEIAELDLGGKPVAVFGCGDANGYGDNFCDAIEELYSTFKAAGAKMVGSVDASGYTFEESKSVQDGKFLGLALDQVNEDDQTEGRVSAWVEQIKGEGMPI